MKQPLKILCAVLAGLFVMANCATALGPCPQQPVPFPRMGPIAAPGQMLDEWPVTIAYDDGIPNQWYEELTNFRLATWFTPPGGPWPFELQYVEFLLPNQGPVTVYLTEDDMGLPGEIIWQTIAFDLPGLVWTSVPVVPAYWFDPDEIFWLMIHSAGPPFEVFDVEPTDEHSLFWYEPWGGWMLSPGDNLIRASGSYPGLFDVGISDITHYDHFFNLNGADVPVTCTVTNYGDWDIEAGDATVYYRRLTEEGVPIPGTEQSLSLPYLNTGTSVEMDFIDRVDVSGRYNAECEVDWAWDEYPPNNVMQIEFQVYTPPDDWLRYDADPWLGATYTYHEGDGFGMEFNPNLEENTYTIEQIQVENIPVLPGSDATVQVLDDGFGPLWEMTLEPVFGWNTFDVGVPTTGSFYIAYIFNTTTTALLCFDHLPKSEQAWMKVDGMWEPDPLAYDWCMRARISVPPMVYIDELVITDPIPPYIPPQGGTLYFTVSGGNNSSIPITLDIWKDITMPNGSYIDTVLLDPNYFIGPYETFAESYSNVIPGNWPPRRYSLNVYLGDFQTFEVYASASAFFYKTVPPGGVGHVMTVGYGNKFADYTLIPSDYYLSQNYPNPFNPTTTLVFGLPEETQVNLAVYDVRGNRVAELVDELMKAGTYALDFNADNFASGVYICRLAACDYASSVKMILVR